MKLKTMSTMSAIVGVTIISFVGSAIARRTGLGGEGWLMMVFALGIVVLSQAQVFHLRQEMRDLEIRSAPRDDR